MLCTLLGYRDVNFTDSSGKVISGLNVFYACPEPYVKGRSCSKAFLSDLSLLPVLESGLDSDLDFQFNNRGKLVSIKPLK